MSAREFDNYLVLLGKFLGLSGPQRDAIAGELSDHFEERLAELESRGVARDRAVRIAVEEFGDAAGLASRFLSLSRNNRRRWIMRSTAFSLAGALTALVLVTAFWPQDNTGPAPRAAAQNQPGGGLGSGGAGAAAPALAVTIDENNAATEAKLAERMPADFSDSQLAYVLQFISDLKEIEIYVDSKALEEEGVSTDVPVSLALKKVRGDMLLDLVLKQAGGLTYVVRDGIVVVSTAAALQQATEVRVYNCRDLLGLSQFGGGQPGAGGYGPPGVGSGPGYPMGPGGEGGRPFPATLPAGSPPSSGGATPVPGGGGTSPGTTTSPPGAGGPPFPPGPGPGETSPPRNVPSATLPSTGAPPRTTPSAPGTPPPPTGNPDEPRGTNDEFDPRTTLRQLFDNQVGGVGGGGQFGGGAGIGGAGGLQGTGAGGGFIGGGMPGAGGGMGMMGGPDPTPAGKLISIIEASVFPDSWANAGGVGTIGEYGGLLVINNNVRAHRQVEELLDMLRAAAGKQPGATVRGR